MNQFAVKVHCGNGYVKGSATKWHYFIASLFGQKITKDKRVIWYNTGTHTYPRRSKKLAEQDGKELAKKWGVNFIDDYGSLHNKPVAADVTD